MKVCVLSCSLALTNPCRREANKSKQFLSHPETKSKFIQCTKRGEMFVFDCEADSEWDPVALKCVKLEQEVRPLIFKTKTRNLNARGQFLRTKPRVNEASTTTTSTTTTTIATTTQLMTSTPVITPELATISNSITELEDKLIINKVREQELPSKREQDLLMNQIVKQEQLIQQNLALQDEIARKHQLDDQIKLKQQIEQQKELLKHKFISLNPTLTSVSNSAQEIQNMIHQHEREEQFRQLRTQRLQQQDVIASKQNADKQHMDDQLIIQQMLHFNHLDNIQGALHNRV